MIQRRRSLSSAGTAFGSVVRAAMRSTVGDGGASLVVVPSGRAYISHSSEWKERNKRHHNQRQQKTLKFRLCAFFCFGNVSAAQTHTSTRHMPMHAPVRANWKCLCVARRGGVAAPPCGWPVLRAAGGDTRHPHPQLYPQLHPQHRSTHRRLLPLRALRLRVVFAAPTTRVAGVCTTSGQLRKKLF